MSICFLLSKNTIKSIINSGMFNKVVEKYGMPDIAIVKTNNE